MRYRVSTSFRPSTKTVEGLEAPFPLAMLDVIADDEQPKSGRQPLHSRPQCPVVVSAQIQVVHGVGRALVVSAPDVHEKTSGQRIRMKTLYMAPRGGDPEHLVHIVPVKDVLEMVVTLEVTDVENTLHSGDEGRAVRDRLLDLVRLLADDSIDPAAWPEKRTKQANMLW
jgi:hypothetical protein